MKKLRITFNSPVILGFVGISFVAMILNYLTGGLTNRWLFSVYRSSLFNPLTYLRFVTHILGHSGWSHYIGNMSYILLIGPILEEKYGSWKIFEVMIITALVTGVLHFIFSPGTSLCGASGVVFAFILMVSFTGFNEGEIPITVILVALIYIGQQVAEGILIKDDVSNFSHILGGIVGAFAGYNHNKKPGQDRL
jgi:GlpG protein